MFDLFSDQLSRVYGLAGMNIELMVWVFGHLAGKYWLRSNIFVSRLGLNIVEVLDWTLKRKSTQISSDFKCFVKERYESILPEALKNSFVVA